MEETQFYNQIASFQVNKAKSHAVISKNYLLSASQSSLPYKNIKSVCLKHKNISCGKICLKFTGLF